MQSLTFQGNPVRLVTEAPDYALGPVTVRATIPTSRIRGLTGRESRRPLGTSLRIELRWEASLHRDEVDSFRNALQVDSTAGDIPFIVPFWPGLVGGFEAASSPLGSAGLWVGGNDDGTGWSVTDDPADLADLDWAAPGLLGRLEAEVAVEEVLLGRARLHFTEDSPAAYGIAPAAETWASGPALPDGTQPKVFPFVITWQEEPKSGWAEVVADRTALGPGRQAAATYWPQNAERPMGATVTVDGVGDLSRLLRWYLDRRGDAEAHLVPALHQTGELEADANAGEEFIIPADPSRFGSNGIALLSDGLVEEWIRITGLDGGALTLSAPLGRDWDRRVAGIQLGMLARHAGGDLEITWEANRVGIARCGWREVRAEIEVGAGETRGSSIGRVADSAFLYTFVLDRGDETPETHRFTSFEADLSADGHTWSAWPIEHAAISQSLALDRDEIQVRIRYCDALSVLLPGRNDALLRLTVHRCSVSGGSGSSLARLYSGEATGFETVGPIVSISFAGSNALFGRRAPRFLVQRGCNYRLFEARCGLDRAGWTLTAAVSAAAGATITLESFVPGASVPGGWGGVHWFALGYLETALKRRYLVVDSTAKDGAGRVAVSLIAPPTPAMGIGDLVTIIPGCDGDVATCQAKFANLVNHGGFPWIPDKSPQFQPRRKDEGAGKK